MQVELTITEALAELKTLDKRIEKKRESIFPYLARQDQTKDPLEKDGGSVKWIKQERQSLDDLEVRKVAIRRAIAKANESTPVSLTISDGTVYAKSLAEWLTWRKEIVPSRQKFIALVRQRLDAVRRDAQQKGITVVANGGETSKPTDVIVNVSESDLSKEAEHLEEVLGMLDGQLSLKNATVKITV